MQVYRKLKCIMAALIIGAALHMAAAEEIPEEKLVTFMQIEMASGEKVAFMVDNELKLLVGEGTLTIGASP
ncbi:MAG: hypothetical protein K2M97_05555, partial [Muribaculaceae bacterium]|nr:hypothetical protein [Muribaculaceae bacterium]